MRLFGVVVAVQIIKVYSALKFSTSKGDEPLTVAAANIVDRCLGSSERWSELLIINDDDSHQILAKIHHKSRTSNLILYLGYAESNEHPQIISSYTNASVQWQDSKPTAVIITIHSLKQLESIFGSLKSDFQRIWRPESYFLIVLETRCNVTELNDVFKVVWDYWILDALILCSSDGAANGNRSEIDLYTFNPYSADHSPQWETIIHETVEVSINPGNFNHSWYIFKKRFTEIKYFTDCRDLFFDKTSNLDGYVIPVSDLVPVLPFGDTKSAVEKWLKIDKHVLKAVASNLQFSVAQVTNKSPDPYGRLLENGSYSGPMNDIYNRRSHLGVARRLLMLYPGVGITYPYDVISACFASRVIGNRPQWMNLASAKHIWIALGLGVLFSTVAFYRQNKPKGIVSAFLDAVRIIIGNSMIRGSAVIKHRIILGAIFLVILVVEGAIKGRFISILTIVSPYPDLDTLEQLKEHMVNMVGPHEFKEWLMDAELESRYFGNDTIDDCLEGLKREGNPQAACFADCLYLSHSGLNLSLVHIAGTPVLSDFATTTTAMHWPLTWRYSFEIQKLVEAGIYGKWKLDLLRDSEIDQRSRSSAMEQSHVKPTKMNDLLPVYVVFFLGLSVALMVFFWEIRACGKASRCGKSSGLNFLSDKKFTCNVHREK